MENELICEKSKSDLEITLDLQKQVCDMGFYAGEILMMLANRDVDRDWLLTGEKVGIMSSVANEVKSLIKERNAFKLEITEEKVKEITDSFYGKPGKTLTTKKP